jgi:hypothetical protein
MRTKRGRQNGAKSIHAGFYAVLSTGGVPTEFHRVEGTLTLSASVAPGFFLVSANRRTIEMHSYHYARAIAKCFKHRPDSTHVLAAKRRS